MSVRRQRTGPEPLREWGPRRWRRFHRLAIRYPNQPTLHEARAAFREIWEGVAGLPCAECRAHAIGYVTGAPPWLASSHTLQDWMFEFHNAVNRRLGKLEFTQEQYRRLYADDFCTADRCASGAHKASARAPASLLPAPAAQRLPAARAARTRPARDPLILTSRSGLGRSLGVAWA